MPPSNKAIIILSVLLAVSLGANYYFYSSGNAEVNEELIKSEERARLLRLGLDTLKRQKIALNRTIDSLNNGLTDNTTETTRIIKIYETEKINIVRLDSDSGVRYLSNRLHNADTLR